MQSVTVRQALMQNHFINSKIPSLITCIPQTQMPTEAFNKYIISSKSSFRVRKLMVVKTRWSSQGWCSDVQMCMVGCSTTMRPDKLSFSDFITFNSSNVNLFLDTHYANVKRRTSILIFGICQSLSVEQKKTNITWVYFK